MTGNRGPLGGSTNRPRIDQGTLNLQQSVPPGPLGRGAQEVRFGSLAMVGWPASPTPVTAPASTTVFHPGVNHGHLPSGRWADIQADPKSSFMLNRLCPWMTPMELVGAAIFSEFGNKPIALTHLNWYMTGRGADFVEDANINVMLFKDKGVQLAIKRKIPTGRTSGMFSSFLKLEQFTYDDQDFRFAFGAIDRLDFEVDFGAGTIHVWFQDRYEWHPYYPRLYLQYPDDAARDTNCLHAALVELKSAVVYLQCADKSITHLNGEYMTSHMLRSAMVSPTATTALALAPLASLPPSTRASAVHARPAAARHRVPGASPVSGVLGHGAAASTYRARGPKPFFQGCPIVLVDCFPRVLENESQGFCLTRTDQF